MKNIDLLKDEDLRPVVCKVIQVLAGAANMKIIDLVALKEAWHLTLVEIPDDLLWKGLKKALGAGGQYMISPGDFKKLIASDYANLQSQKEVEETRRKYISHDKH